jgi:transcription antitermination factor NusB
MNPRRQGRILAMQALCQLDVQGDSFAQQLDGFLADAEASAAAREYARRLIEAVRARRTAYDELIRSISEHWDVQRMPLVDRNIVRVGVCELLEPLDVPPAVAIDEAIEIAKEYGGADSPAFVNGILDAVRNRGGTQQS